MFTVVRQLYFVYWSYVKSHPIIQCVLNMCFGKQNILYQRILGLKNIQPSRFFPLKMFPITLTYYIKKYLGEQIFTEYAPSLHIYNAYAFFNNMFLRINELLLLNMPCLICCLLSVFPYCVVRHSWGQSFWGFFLCHFLSSLTT